MLFIVSLSYCNAKKNASYYRRVNVCSDLNFRKINRALIGFGESQMPTGLVQRSRSRHIYLFLVMYDPATAMGQQDHYNHPV